MALPIHSPKPNTATMHFDVSGEVKPQLDKNSLVLFRVN